MPWKEFSRMSLREEFVRLAQAPGSNRRLLCRRFGISPKTGYKWLERFARAGSAGLVDHSRRPRHSPTRTGVPVQEQITALRQAHPAWGARKIHARLRNLQLPDLPAISTVNAILTRQDMIHPRDSAQARPWQRFERPGPNELWQMDFKGHFPLLRGRCCALTLLDDHSRYALCLAACANQTTATVQDKLTSVFQRYGLPRAILCDNGAPFGGGADHPFTLLGAWLIRLGASVHHGHAYHPQTQGKEERFHRTLQAEVLNGQHYPDLARVQAAFDPWRAMYNHQRPHEALGNQPPASRYQPSPIEFPRILPPIVYGPDDTICQVNAKGRITFQGHALTVSQAFAGNPVGVRATADDGRWDVYFCHQKVAQFDLRTDTAS